MNNIEEKAKEYVKKLYCIHNEKDEALVKTIMNRDYFKADVQIFKAGYQSGKQDSKWISVKDQLPDLGKLVLVWVSEDFNCCEVAYLERVDTNFMVKWETMSDLGKYRELTHWMPLPQPPKQL